MVLPTITAAHGSNEPDRNRLCGSSPANERDAVGDVVYTRDEVNGNDELLLRVRSDGVESYVNLYLSETGLFTGRYEGYIRLTDANGDGTGIDQSGASTDWGAKVRHGRAGNQRIRRGRHRCSERAGNDRVSRFWWASSEPADRN